MRSSLQGNVRGEFREGWIPTIFKPSLDCSAGAVEGIVRSADGQVIQFSGGTSERDAAMAVPATNPSIVLPLISLCLACLLQNRVKLC
ncbi:MAG: hypothetical protein RIQ81_1503 [Pseudomonadota bacterium]